MERMTNAQVALMAATAAKRPDHYETPQSTVDRATAFLRFLNDNS